MDFPAGRRLPEILAHILILFVSSFAVKAQPFHGQNNNLPSQDAVANFQPSLAVVVGILCIMFSLTFILLIYAKCCHRPASARFNGDQSQDGLPQSTSRFSGIDKTVIESLPFFRFSALKGTREGLECAVCLCKFEDIEILRLLPKCKHAFHIDCVDQWLEKHSSCPLCRHKVSEDDVTVFTYSNSLRFLRNQSELRGDSNLEIFVQREESSRFGSGRSFRRFEKGKKEEELPIQESGQSDEILHKFNHKIIVSDAVLKNRWSSVSSSDLMFLKSEMINSISSNRFSPLNSNTGKLAATAKVMEDGEVIKIKEEMERKREFESKISQTEIFPFPSDSTTRGSSGFSSKELTRSNDKRSMSEIVVHSRFTESSMANSSSNREESQDRQRRLWLPIARRTIQWFANRERRPPQSKNTKESLDV